MLWKKPRAGLRVRFRIFIPLQAASRTVLFDWPCPCVALSSLSYLPSAQSQLGVGTSCDTHCRCSKERQGKAGLG